MSVDVWVVKSRSLVSSVLFAFPRVLSIACSYNLPSGDSLISQLVKNPPAMQETLVRSLGREDPLEKG